MCPEWLDDMSNCGLLFQWASTIKIQIRMLVRQSKWESNCLNDNLINSHHTLIFTSFLIVNTFKWTTIQFQKVFSKPFDILNLPCFFSAHFSWLIINKRPIMHNFLLKNWNHSWNNYQIVIIHYKVVTSCMLIVLDL